MKIYPATYIKYRALSNDSEPRLMNAYTPPLGCGHLFEGVRLYAYSYLGYIWEGTEGVGAALEAYPERTKRLIDEFERSDISDKP